MVLLLVPWRIVWLLCIVVASRLPWYTDAGSSSEEQHHRRLQNQQVRPNFDALNSILQHGVFYIGDASVTDARVAELELSTMRCQDMMVGDIRVESQQLNERQVQVDVSILDLDMRCDLNYSYTTALLLRGAGKAIVVSEGNSVNTTTIVESRGNDGEGTLESMAADTIAVDMCRANMNVTEMEFPDGVILGLAPVEALIKLVVERRVQKLTCEFLTDTQYLQQWLEIVELSFDKYPPDQQPAPLEREIALLSNLPDDITVMNFLRESTVQRALLDMIYDRVTTYLTTTVDGTWRANTLIRDYLLMGESIYTLENDEDLFFWQGSDRLLDSTVRIDKVELSGLDSLTALNPLRSIGLHTLQNEVSFGSLTFHVHCSVFVQPSQRSDSYIGSTHNNVTVSETTIVSLQFDDVDAVASFLVAFDDVELARLQLGSLMQSDELLPCILSTLYRLELATVSVTVGTMGPPTITPFKSSGLESVFNNSMGALVNVYQDIALRSLPAFFQERVARSLRDNLNVWFETQNTTACSKVEIRSNRVLDLRDLLMDPMAAAAAGGKGTNPYGDVVFNALAELNTRYWEPNEAGVPKVNEALIQPVTKDQSGVVGTLHFDRSIDLLNLETVEFTSLATNGILRASQPRFFDLNTVTAPVQVLQAGGPIALNNSIHMGSLENRTFGFSTDLLFQIDSGNSRSPLAAHNDMELTMTFQVKSKVNFLILLMEEDFLRFALAGISDLNCWLATLMLPSFDDNFIPEYPSGIELSEFAVDLSAIDIDVFCSSCTSRGFDFFPEIVAAMRHRGVLEMVELRVESLVNEVVIDYWKSLQMPLHLWNARLVCPSNEHYNPEATQTIKWQPFPNFSRESIETILFFSSLAAHVGMILTAKSHLLMSTNVNPLSAQAELPRKQSLELLDWTNPNESLGSWAESAFSQMRTFLSTSSIDNELGLPDLGANIVVREVFDEGKFKLDLNGAKLDLGGTRGAISQLRFLGLDSMKRAEAVIPVAPQTLSNQFEFEELLMELDVAFDIYPEETFTMQWGLDDVYVNVTLFAALNWEELGSAWIGSMLRTGDIVQCAIGKLRSANITQLSVTAGDIHPPQIHGILTDQAKSSLLSLSSDFFDDFRNDVLESVTSISATTLRETINHVLVQYLDSSDKLCTHGAPMTESGLVDFRDLLAPSAQAAELGASGTEPYGDVVLTLIDAFHAKVAADEMKNRSLVVRLSEMIGLNVTKHGEFYLSETVSASGSSSPRFSDWVLNYTAKVSDFYVTNLDSLKLPLEVLKPVEDEPYILDNALTLGIGSEPLQLGATLFFALHDNQGNTLDNEIKVEMEFQAISTLLRVLLTVNETELLSTPLHDIQDPYCLLASISLPALQEANLGNPFVHYSLSADRVALNVTCIECQGPRMAELLLQLYNPGESDEEVRDFIAATSSVLENFVGSGFLQDYFHHIVDSSKKLCPSSPSYDATAQPPKLWGLPDSDFGFAPFRRDPRMELFNIANIALGIVMAVLLFVVERLARKRHAQWLQGLSPEHIACIEQQKADEVDRLEYIEQYTGPMSTSREIPFRLRLAVPFVLVLNIGLYLAAHISLLSYMNIEADIAGQRLTIVRFMEFSFFGAAMRTYWTGGREMALMAIIFSGIWPYIKLVSALVLWFAPPSTLKVSHRGKVIVWMEVLTKLSIIDIAMMLLAVATLLVFVSGPGEEFYGSDDLYAVTIAVVPRAGFYCILVAQRINRVSSRFFLDYHEKIVSSASAKFWREKTNGGDGTRTTRLTDDSSNESVHQVPPIKIIPPLPVTPEEDEDASSTEGAFEIARVDSDFRRRVMFVFDSPAALIETFRVNYLYLSTRYHLLSGTVGAVLACFCVLTLFIIGGALAPSISVDVKESLAIALESDRTYTRAVADFNVFNIIILALLKSRFVLSSTSDYVGLCILMSLVIVGGMLVPAIQGWQRLLETFQKLLQICQRRSSTQNRIFFRREVRLRQPLELWQHLEIYVFAFCIATWQLGAVVAFFIHNYCQNLERFYDALSYAGLVKDDSTNCFAAQASSPLTLIILFGSFLFLLFSSVCQVVGQYRRNSQQFEREKV